MESTWTTQTWQSIRGADHSQVITETNSNIGGGSMLLIHSASLLPIQTAANGYGSKFETHENYSRDWVMFSNKELHPTSILLRPPSLLRLIFIQFFVGWNTSKTSWSNDPISFREISRLFGWKSLTKSLVSWLNPTILGWSVEPPEISGASPA